MGRDLLQELRRLPRRFTPRNDIILSCHCERSEAISSNGPVIASIAKQSHEKQTRLRRHVAPCNNIV